MSSASHAVLWSLGHVSLPLRPPFTPTARPVLCLMVQGGATNWTIGWCMGPSLLRRAKLSWRQLTRWARSGQRLPNYCLAGATMPSKTIVGVEQTRSSITVRFSKSDRGPCRETSPSSALFGHICVPYMSVAVHLCRVQSSGQASPPRLRQPHQQRQQGRG